MSTEEGGPEGGLIEFQRTIPTLPGSIYPTRPRLDLPYPAQARSTLLGRVGNIDRQGVLPGWILGTRRTSHLQGS